MQNISTEPYVAMIKVKNLREREHLFISCKNHFRQVSEKVKKSFYT